MKYPIKHRWNDSVLFEAEIECTADTSDGIKLGLAVKAAIKADVTGTLAEAETA